MHVTESRSEGVGFLPTHKIIATIYSIYLRKKSDQLYIYPNHTYNKFGIDLLFHFNS